MNIQALRDRKTVVLNLTRMNPDQAQRAVEDVDGGDDVAFAEPQCT